LKLDGLYVVKTSLNPGAFCLALFKNTFSNAQVAYQNTGRSMMMMMR
jgi:hypothetical protein